MNILITAPFDENYIKELEKQHTVFYESWEKTLVFGKGQALVDRFNKDNIEVLVTEVDKIDDDVLNQCPQLKLICDCRGNPTNVDIEAATRHKVPVTYTPGRNAIAVAEHCLGLMLAIARYIPQGDVAIRKNQWDQGTYFRFQGTEISGKTIGLIGFGAVARELAKRLAGFDVRLISYDPYIPEEVAKNLDTELVTIEKLMQESDFVSIHLPVTEQTKGFVDAAKLEMMKPSAFFINTGRTITIDEEKVLDMLKTKRIAGGAFDVFSSEPLSEGNAYVKLANVVLTPHIAGASKEIATHQAKMIVEDIAAFIAGKRPKRLFNKEVTL